MSLVAGTGALTQPQTALPAYHTPFALHPSENSFITENTREISKIYRPDEHKTANRGVINAITELMNEENYGEPTIVTWLGRGVTWAWNKLAGAPESKLQTEKLQKEQQTASKTLSNEIKETSQQFFFWSDTVEFPPCLYEGETYRQRWQAGYSFYYNPDNPSQSIDNIDHFKDGITRCFTNRVVEPYLQAIANTQAARSCNFVQSDQYDNGRSFPDGWFSVDIWGDNYSNKLFLGQTDLTISEENTAACFWNNQHQDPLPGEAARTDSKSGTSDVINYGYWCNREIIQQTWSFTPPDVDLRWVGSGQRCFDKSYVDCAFNNVIKPYFKSLADQASGCNAINSTLTVLNMTLIDGSLFNIASPSGIPAYQLEAGQTFNFDIESCYNDAANPCLERADTVRRFVMVSGIFTFLASFGLSCFATGAYVIKYRVPSTTIATREVEIELQDTASDASQQGIHDVSPTASLTPEDK